MKLIQLAYSSRAKKNFSDIEMLEFLDRFRKKNTEMGITGILIYKDGHFLQFLEGEENKIDSLYAAIEKDKRHDNVILLLREEIEKRSFRDWSMGYVDLDKLDQDSIPVFTNIFDMKISFLDFKGEAEVIKDIIKGFSRYDDWRNFINV